MNGKIFYTLGIGFTGGVFLRSFFDIGLSGVALIMLMSFACGVVWRMKAFGFHSPLFIIAVLLISIACGVFRLHTAESRVSALREYENEKVVLVGTVVREPEFREKMLHIYVEPALQDVDEYVLVTTDKFSFTEDNIEYGDSVRVTGVVKKPEPFSSQDGRTFDYPGYLKARNTEYVIQFGDVAVDSAPNESSVVSLYRGKHTFMNVLERHIPSPEAGLGEGVLLGVKRSMGDELEQVFRETGIIHIVVLSGYNIMIVVVGVMYVLSFFFFPRTRMILGIGVVIVFAILVGFSATVVRASLMAILLIIAQSTGKIYAVLRALMIALLGMLLWNPYLLVHDPGFQLSFLATIGLILLSPPIEKRLSFIPETLNIRGFVSATLATQITVLPLLLYHMGLFSVVSVLVNVLVLPMVPVAMGLTFLTGVGGLFMESVGMIVGFSAYVSLKYIIVVAQLFSILPFASFSVSVFPFWVVLCAYGVLIYGYIVLNTHDSEEEENEVVNEYDGWVIEEEKEKPVGELRSNSPTGPFPFR